MRNLKRALSLALASVMLVGMMVVGTSAASYPDVDSNDNVEAIAVLQAVEVMQGDADTGNFRPDDEVSRNEMAVIMARLLLGPDADSYVGTHPFTDVPAWADKYVAACYNDGIIKGMDDTTYGGKDTVTAQQAAAMMLRALGYEKLEDSGADWARRVVQKANQISLFKSVGSNPNAAMTRNQIAQLSLNTLEATMVTTETGANINLGEIGSITTDVKYIDRTESSTSSNDACRAFNDAPVDGKYALQLGEYLYNGDLKKVAGEADDFGRPADHAWTMKGVSGKVGNAVKEPVATFTGKTSAGDVASALSGYYVSYTDASNNVPVNDKDKVTSASVADTIPVSNETVAKAIADKTANGKVYEFFANDSNVIDAVVDITYQVSEVTNVRETSKGTTYTVSPGGSGTVFNPDEDTDDTVVIMGDVAKGDIVTNVVANGVRYIYPTTTFEGVQSSRNTSKNTITVDGRTYDVGVGLTNVSFSDFPNSSDEATFYVDQYGYVVKSEAVENDSEYAVVDEIRYKDDGGIGSTKSVEARMVFTDGTSQIVKVTEINGKKVSESAEVVKVDSTTEGEITGSAGAVDTVKLNTNIQYNGKLSGKVVKYTKSGSDYKITYSVSITGTTVKMSNSGTTGTTDVVTESGKPSFVYTTGVPSTTETANKDTVYIIKTDDAKYSVYTGYQNVTKVTANGAGVKVSYSVDDNKVNVVYIDAYGDGTNKATTGDTSSEIVYILDEEAYSEYKNSDGDVRYEYTAAALNGDDSKPVISQVQFTAKGLYEVKLTEDDEVKEIVTTNTAPTGTKWAKINVTAVSDDADQVIANGKGYVCSDADVYVIDDKNFYEGDGTSADIGDTVFIKTKGNPSNDGKDDITAEIVYIVKAASDSATVPGSIGASEIEKLFNEQGKDEVTVTGALNQDVRVPANKKLIVNANSTGAVTLGEGATLELGSGVTALPTITGKGTVEIKGTIAADGADTTAQLNNLASKIGNSQPDVAKPSAGEGGAQVATVTLDNNGADLTGDGKLNAFNPNKKISDYIADTNGASSVRLFKVTMTGLTVGDKVKGEKLVGNTWVAMDGVLGDGNYAVTETELGIVLLLPNTVTQVRFTVVNASGGGEGAP